MVTSDNRKQRQRSPGEGKSYYSPCLWPGEHFPGCSAGKRNSNRSRVLSELERPSWEFLKRKVKRVSSTVEKQLQKKRAPEVWQAWLMVQDCEQTTCGPRKAYLKGASRSTSRTQQARKSPYFLQPECKGPLTLRTPAEY